MAPEVLVDVAGVVAIGIMVFGSKGRAVWGLESVEAGSRAGVTDAFAASAVVGPASAAVALPDVTPPVEDVEVDVPLSVWLMEINWSSWLSEIIWPTIAVESTGAVGS